MCFWVQKLQSELDALRSRLGDVSRRCVGFFEEKSASPGVPALRSELGQAVDRMDKLHHLSSVYLEKSASRFWSGVKTAPVIFSADFIFFLLRLKSVEVLLRRLEEAESQVRKYESRLSEEDIVPADPAAIQNLRDQLGVRPPPTPRL